MQGAAKKWLRYDDAVSKVNIVLLYLGGIIVITICIFRVYISIICASMRVFVVFGG